MSQENEIEIQHRIVIEEDDIEISELPNEIRNAMRRFNTKLKEFEVSGDADLFHELMQDDIVIADNITTWIEDNLSEEEEEDDSYADDSKVLHKLKLHKLQNKCILWSKRFVILLRTELLALRN